jgi:malonyl-CoA O-methyltransferase
LETILKTKETIKRNFSRRAEDYDSHSLIQSLCAAKLLAKIEKEPRGSILDIGCGTGNFTRLLRRAFPLAAIKAVDISHEMVRLAGKKLEGSGVEFIVGDAETIELDGKFDLITSNASLQWFMDLNKGLARYRDLLGKGGLMAFSIFGPRTLAELDCSMKIFFGGESSVYSRLFMDRDGLAEALKRSFEEVALDEAIFIEEHHSLSELLNNVRYTGTRGARPNGDGLWTPKKIAGLERIYKSEFGAIMATYQVFFCRGSG